MNASCTMRQLAHKPEQDGALFHYPAGSFYWSIVSYNGQDLRYLNIKLPPGHKRSFASIPVGPTTIRNANAWDWNGNLDKPSLSPSVAHGDRGDEWYWHGHLHDGELVGCAE